MLVERALHQLRGPLGIDEIHRHRRHTIDALQRPGRPRAGDDGRSLVNERPHHRKPDPLARTGDDGDLAGEPEVHGATLRERGAVAGKDALCMGADVCDCRLRTRSAELVPPLTRLSLGGGDCASARTPDARPGPDALVAGSRMACVPHGEGTSGSTWPSSWAPSVTSETFRPISWSMTARSWAWSLQSP